MCVVITLYSSDLGLVESPQTIITVVVTSLDFFLKTTVVIS
jgi:hypothetical protein